MLPVNDKEWGQRHVGLVRWNTNTTKIEQDKQLRVNKALIQNWLPAERPLSWYTCPQLVPYAAGKWERLKWLDWLKRHTTLLVFNIEIS